MINAGQDKEVLKMILFHEERVMRKKVDAIHLGVRNVFLLSHVLCAVKSFRV